MNTNEVWDTYFVKVIMMIRKEKTGNLHYIKQIIFLIEQVYFYLLLIFVNTNRNKFVKKRFVNDRYFFRKKKQNLYRNLLVSMISIFHEKKNGNNLKMVCISHKWRLLFVNGNSMIVIEKIK